MSWRDPQVKKKSPEAPAGDRMSLVYDAAARGDYSAALEIWTPLAHAGVARAQSNIGACFSDSAIWRRSISGETASTRITPERPPFIAQPPNKAMSRCRTC